MLIFLLLKFIYSGYKWRGWKKGYCASSDKTTRQPNVKTTQAPPTRKSTVNPTEDKEECEVSVF